MTTQQAAATAPADLDERGRRVDGDARRQLLAGVLVTERRIDLADISTAILEGGDGPPLVLLHGPGGWTRTPSSD